MRIQHNIMAMNAYRNYNNNNKALSGNLEKLSSGYKINRAGDDAAGLAISEKMRAQITGLNAAAKNVKDGTSLVKTAEGAMQEIQDMLNRMDYLATQSANGTYDNEVDRLNLQKEVTALKDEINRIADSANFNGIKLLDGSQDGGGTSTQATVKLPDVGTPIGDQTVLKGTGVKAGKTVFDVQFDTLQIDAKAGDTLKVSIGDTDVTLTLKEQTYTASDLATELKNAFESTAAGGASGQLKVGQSQVGFDVAVNGTSVTFTQKNDPTGSSDTVPAMMDVKMTYQAAAAGSKAVQLNDDLLISTQDDTPSSVGGDADTAIDVKGDGTAGVKGTYVSTAVSASTTDSNTGKVFNVDIGGKTYGVATTATSVKDQADAWATAYNADEANDGWTAVADSNGAITITKDADNDDASTKAPSVTGGTEGTDSSSSKPNVTFTAHTQVTSQTATKFDLAVDGKTYAIDKTKTEVADQMQAWVDAYNADSANSAYSAAVGTGDNAGKIVITQKAAADTSSNPTGLTGGTWTDGEAGSPASLTADASGLTTDAIKTAADGIKNIASGAITIKANSDNKLELLVSGNVVGTSDETIGNSTTTFTFKTADDTPVSLGSITFSAAPAASDIPTGGIDTGLTYTAAGGTGPTPPDPSKPQTVNTELDLSTALAGVDTTDMDATLSQADITAVKNAFDALGSGAKKIVVNQEVDVDLSTVTDGLKTDGSATMQDLADALLAAAKAGADAWNAANTDKDYTYTNVRISTTATGANDSDIIAQANGDSLYILMDKTPKTTPTPTPAGDKPANVSGSYNAGTVKIQQGAAENGAATASTMIKLPDIFGSDIGEGSTLTIGKETYTFKWGDSFKTEGKTIILDKNATAAERMKQAGIGLSNMDNSAFTIGNVTANGEITIDEKPGQSVYTTELTSKPGFEALFSATRVSAKTGKGLTLQIGDTSESFNQLTVSIGDMHTKALGIDGIDIGNQAGAQAAISTIKNAINYVSGVRGDLGAVQNRLDHTANNLSVMAENIQDAESSIRDTDVAEEMMSYVKNNILVQSAQAMLAQANQVPQGVLQLLG